MELHRLVIIMILVEATFVFNCSTAVKQGDRCGFNATCDLGLNCQPCFANLVFRPRCTRIKPINPTSQVKSQPFNRYTWLTTHNSFAMMGTRSISGSLIFLGTNQQDSITSQLNNGVRGLMLDMYEFNNDIWLCHGQCSNTTAFQPAMNVLKEVQTFLGANPTEIITIFIEDYVATPNAVKKLFDATNLRNLSFPVSEMPKDGKDWPTVNEMVQKNQRLLVFTSRPEKESSEGIAYQWNYVVENQYGDGGMTAGFCPNREESEPVKNKTKSLVVMNYFRGGANVITACKDNSAPLLSMANTCYKAAANRWPNYIALDFYLMNDGGGAAAALDAVNGGIVCGCPNISNCKENMSPGVCK